MIWDVLASVMQPDPVAMRSGTNGNSIRAVERVYPRADRLPVLEAPLRSPIVILQIAITDTPIPLHALGSMRERHRQRSAVVGAFDWSMATLQRRVDRSGPAPIDTGPVLKSWSAGTEVGWTSSGGDRLSIGGRYTIDRALTTIGTYRHLHIHSGTSIAEIGWDHRSDWRSAIARWAAACRPRRSNGASRLPTARPAVERACRRPSPCKSTAWERAPMGRSAHKSFARPSRRTSHCAARPVPAPTTACRCSCGRASDLCGISA